MWKLYSSAALELEALAPPCVAVAVNVIPSSTPCAATEADAVHLVQSDTRPHIDGHIPDLSRADRSA